MILHTFNKASALATGAPFVQSNDLVLLIEDGVYALLANDLNLASAHVYALDVDITTRGLSSRIDEAIKLVSYQEFVQLCCDANSISNWS
jgi:sulfur relay protein TusB/DsrH